MDGEIFTIDPLLLHCVNYVVCPDPRNKYTKRDQKVQAHPIKHTIPWE